MMLRNAARLLVTNFSLTWKNLLYRLIILGICGALVAWAVQPIVDLLASTSFFSDVSDFILNWANYQFAERMAEIAGFIAVLGNTIIASFAQIVGSVIALCLIFVLYHFFVYVAEVASCEVIRGYMSSYTKFGFTSSLVRKLGGAGKLSLCKLLFAVPCTIVILVVMFFTCHLATLGELWLFFAPCLLILTITILWSIQITLFACWAPSLVSHEIGAWKSFAKGNNALKRNFFPIYSNALVLALAILVINMLCAQVTFFISLIITLPATYLLLAAFEMVVYFESQGMRYYVDSQNIISPKKFEQQDTPKKAKNII